MPWPSLLGPALAACMHAATGPAVCNDWTAPVGTQLYDDAIVTQMAMHRPPQYGS